MLKLAFVLVRANAPIRPLVFQSPVYPPLHLLDEPRIFEKISQGYQSVEEIRSAFPTLTSPSQPSAVGAKIRPKLVQMAAEAVCLNL
jgi:hypothetical protein